MSIEEDDRQLRHECGVFGCIASDPWPTDLDVAQIISLGLLALQHRGQESAGIAVSEGDNHTHFNVKKGMGLVSNIFNDEATKKLKEKNIPILRNFTEHFAIRPVPLWQGVAWGCAEELVLSASVCSLTGQSILKLYHIGNLGIGHTRYSTSAGSEEVNCQPFVVHSAHGALAVAHNGELFNAGRLRRMVLARGVGLSTHSDSELITQALCLNPPDIEIDGPDWPARIRHFMELTKLSYSIVIMEKDRIFGVRDPYGNRPLCIGKLMSLTDPDKEEGWVVSSESCGFLSMGAKYVRDVYPGEIVEFTKEGFHTVSVMGRPHNRPQAFCIFEYVYFARPDSIYEGQMVYSVRLRSGIVLARESFVEADIVSSVPESGTAAAHGFSMKSNIPFAEVLYKNRYVGRTFIQPNARLRRLGVAKKFGAIVENVAGKRLILIDDSIVRGTTMGPIIKLLRDAGAKEVHIRVASPPLKFTCNMGINIPTKAELIANKLTIEQLAKHIGADTLAYLSVEGLKEAVTEKMPNKTAVEVGHCTACLTGEYPEELTF